MVVFLSHVTRQKGLHVLLRALPRIRETWPLVRVVVAGVGDYLADGQALAQRLGVSPHVVFVGDVPHERAPEYLAACDVFVLPTLRQEGLPFALLEGMASEKPVLVSRIGGVTSVVRDGVNGLLVRAGDPEALAEGLSRLLADRELARRLARSARDTVLRAFSAEHMVRGTADVFERVVKARRAPGPRLRRRWSRSSSRRTTMPRPWRLAWSRWAGSTTRAGRPRSSSGTTPPWTTPGGAWSRPSIACAGRDGSTFACSAAPRTREATFPTTWPRPSSTPGAPISSVSTPTSRLHRTFSPGWWPWRTRAGSRSSARGRSTSTGRTAPRTAPASWLVGAPATTTRIQTSRSTATT